MLRDEITSGKNIGFEVEYKREDFQKKKGHSFHGRKPVYGYL